MMNINKKIGIIFFIIFAILSTAFAYSVNAEEYSGSYGNEDNGFIFYEKETHIKGEYNNEYGDFDLTILKGDMRGLLIIESLRQHSYDDGGYIPLSDLYEFYDVLCCQKGTKLPSQNETELVGSNGDRLGLSFPYLTNNDIGMTIFKGDDRREPFPSYTYTNLTLGYYYGGTIHIARPKEAYILAEMVRELEGAVFYYDVATDANGNKVKYEGSLEGSESFLIGDEEIYIVEKQYVTTLDDGSIVKVEAVSDGNGGVIYVYSEGSYQNHYEKYEGSLEWSESKTGTSGMYPSFEYNSSSSSITNIENQVPNGSQIYVTGSNIVVKEDDEYYRATVEGNNSYIQLAWWTTIAGGTGNYVADTAFSQEADAFEAYILQAAGVTSTDDLEYTTVTVLDENGNEKTYENAFKIEYAPDWIVSDEYEYPTTVFEDDKQTFLVGPFSIDYIQASAQFGGRPEVEFAGITNMELYTDAQEEALVYGEDWELVYLDGERTETSEETEEISYPNSNEKFYIRLYAIENATKITNIKVDFRYMNAAGSWQELRGKYFKATWTQQHKDFYKWVRVYNEETEEYEVEEVYDYTQYWLELTSLEQHDSQFLGLGIKGAKWYQYVTIERKLDVYDGKVVIEKELVDENGNEIENVDENKFFTFKVTVEGAINAGTEIVKVKAGDSVESKVYYWMGDEKPTYKVEEISDPEYELIEIKNSTGTIEPDGIKTATAIAINKVKDPDEGYIDIIKVMEENELEGTTLVGNTFNFEVTINGDFEYDGKEYENGTVTIPVTVTAAANAESATPTTIGPIYWYKEAPTYKVVELAKEGSSLVTITPETGKLVAKTDDFAHVVVTAVNKQDIEKNSIRIIKTLEGSSDVSREYIESLEFTFDIKVDGYDTERITLTTPTGIVDGNWVWEGNSSEYVWLYGNNPNYTIEEVNVPEGTTFDDGRSQVTGTLINDTTDTYEVVNNIINKLNDPNRGKIEITKNVEDSTLIDKDYKFAVVITGNEYEYDAPDGTVIKALKDENGEKYFTFGSDETKYYGEALQLTNTSAVVLELSDEYDDYNFVVIKAESTGTGSGKGTWTSGEFKWYGNSAPEYKVEENLLGEDIASSVEPSEGTLSDAEEGADTVKVTAWNRDNTPKGGYIHIIKTLENADKYSVDYVKSLVFKFKIEVEGYDSTVVSLQPKLVDNTWVWEYTSDRYSWKKDQAAPTYTITEIDLPEGTEFVSATNDGGTVTGTPSITGTLKESVSEEVLITTDNSFINKLPDANQGDLTIKKEVTHESLLGQQFKFKVTLKGSFEYNGTTYTNEEVTIYDEVNPLVVEGGSSKNIGTITWYGEDAPEYTIIELDSEIANNISIVNGSGTIKKGTEATIVTFTNEPILVGGYLSITKTLTENKGLQDEYFYFKVTVQGYEPYVIGIKANETYKSEMYKWYSTEAAPTYKVEEISVPDGATLVSITNAEGQLVADKTVATQVIAENKYEEHTGTFQIKKVVLDEKLIDAAAEQEFKMKVTVEGYFEVVGQDGIYTTGTFDVSLKGGQTFTSPEIRWWGEKAPTVTVVEYDIPKGWQNVGISNNGAPIDEDNSLVITVTNKLPVYVTLDLTTKLAGQVWEDEAQDTDGKNTAESVPNGLIDASEKAISNVEVYIYKIVRDGQGNEVERSLATVYKDINNTEVSLPIVTCSDGTWEAPRVKIPTVTDEQKSAGYTASYDVEFVYDGQTYEPTTFLATSNGDAASFINASTAEKDKYAKDSMALDYDREVVNDRIKTVSGNTPIDGAGNTTGTAEGNDGNSSLYYESNAVTNNGNDNKKVVSTLVTTNEDGSVKELFKAKARTSIGGLTFPFYRDTQNWNGFHLYNENTSITELGVEQRYYYEAVYNYCLHINLGLVKRENADMGLVKDLYSATVYVKGDVESKEFETFRFNTLADINADFYTRNVENQVTVDYTLGLYATDYYYRAEMYQANSRLYDKVENLTKEIDAEYADMEVELKYKISVYNESGSYIQVLKSINDYFDSSYGTPTEVKLLNRSESVNYHVAETGILGSDGVTYNKLVIDGLDLKLASGEIAEFEVTFRVQKETINGVRDTIITGQKSNIAEIASYSTEYADGRNAGKVDKDSAPANLNIRNYNESSWYEDDTDAAPVLYLEVVNEERTINGKVWEDRPVDGTTTGDGILDTSNEAVIGGLTTQLVEKVVVDNTEYDFIWPTNESLNCLGGRSMKDLTGFDSTIETLREQVVENEGEENENVVAEVGSYKFEGVPTGNYVVRFTYGNDKTELEDTLGITSDPVALKDGVLYSGNENILTANYDGDKEGMTAAVYNGQDYKATIYQAGFATTDANGYVSNRYHDITNQSLAEARVSDARDSEARRLEVIANSETITNSNATVLATANDKAADHTQLYRLYYMYADTAIINLELENANENVTTITNIDCGLVERPETALVLDKQISEIKMTTNDNNVIFKAAYDITYELESNPSDKTVIAKVNDKYLVANVVLNSSSIGTDVLQAINKNENKLSLENEENQGTQNFRFINIEDEMFQGTTIEIDYQLTALNVGETDYTSTTVENIREVAKANDSCEKLELLKLAKELNINNAKTDAALEIGKYLGTNYYTGNIGNDTVVTTRVRQVVDYVDNDAIFTQSMNNSLDNTWKNTNITELSGNGYDENRLVDKTVISEYELVDKHGVSYITAQKNNLVLSIDSVDAEVGTGNSGFEAKLVPYENNQDAYKSQISLIVTKTVSAQDKDLTYDNIAEIVKFQNTVGRRDILTVTGNANPKLGEFTAALEERDSSATELVTFTPPTGIETEVTITTQVLIVVMIALVILIGGVIIIKKKVL